LTIVDYDNGCPQRLLMIAKCDLVDENRLKSYIALLSSSMKSSVRDGSGANFREKAEGWASPNLRPWRATAFNEAGTRKQNSVGTPAGRQLNAITANAKPKNFGHQKISAGHHSPLCNFPATALVHANNPIEQGISFA